MDPKLLNNPHYTEGRRKGYIILENLPYTTYKTLDIALESKRNYGMLLQKELGMKSTDPTYLENLGIVDVLEYEFNKNSNNGTLSSSVH